MEYEFDGWYFEVANVVFEPRSWWNPGTLDYSILISEFDGKPVSEYDIPDQIEEVLSELIVEDLKN